jgi:hypothetical protein
LRKNRALGGIAADDGEATPDAIASRIQGHRARTCCASNTPFMPPGILMSLNKATIRAALIPKQQIASFELAASKTMKP